MKAITAYDPPICRTTGACGPEVDPNLAQLTGDLDWLKKRGEQVRRINLAQEPGRFVEIPAVEALLDHSGGDSLPAIVIGDEVVANGRYPERREPCFKFHCDEARKLSVSTTALREAIRIGEVVKQAAVTNISSIADRMFGSDEPNSEPTKIIIVTLPETTPVLEAARLQQDLRRAGIEPWAWIVNASLAAAHTHHPLLRHRAGFEHAQIAKVSHELASRCAVVPMTARGPIGAVRLRALVQSAAGEASRSATAPATVTARGTASKLSA